MDPGRVGTRGHPPGGPGLRSPGTGSGLDRSRAQVQREASPSPERAGPDHAGSQSCTRSRASDLHRARRVGRSRRPTGRCARATPRRACPRALRVDSGGGRAGQQDLLCGGRRTGQERSVSFATTVPFLANCFLARSCQSSSTDALSRVASRVLSGGSSRQPRPPAGLLPFCRGSPARRRSGFSLSASSLAAAVHKISGP
jgi:hypothetical protein